MVLLVGESLFQKWQSVIVFLVVYKLGKWDIGEYISRRVSDGGWGKSVVKDFSDYIQSRYVAIRGFPASNIWRMKQFLKTKNSQHCRENYTHTRLDFFCQQLLFTLLHQTFETALAKACLSLPGVRLLLNPYSCQHKRCTYQSPSWLHCRTNSSLASATPFR
ncbi:MAG: DUF1016 N-terminal domain-containing protein [Eubacteriaceae bacterium]|nr:DUF1016 N-terminal domain-containing protein [Eubacteriaceae bacterium]